jgi:hypothetical protein
MSPSKRSEKNAELELEQEVDFGRYFAALARGWWLLLAGLVIGAVIGVAMSLGSGNLYKAKATVYLGQPLAVTGSTQLQGVNTNPSSVSQLAHSEEVLTQVSKLSGLPLKKLRSGVSTASVSGNLSKLGQTPLVTISVQAKGKRKSVQDAANALAQTVVMRLSQYSISKVVILQAQIASDIKQIAAIDIRMSSIAASDAAMAALSEQRRGTLSDELQTDQLLLAQAKMVEQGSILTKATATKTTGRNRRSSLVVGAALGLLIGALVALTLPGSRRSRAS